MTIYGMSVSAAFLILAIVVIRALAIHKLPKITFVGLWGVAVFRLLIPFSIPSSFSLNTALDRLNGFLPEQSSAPAASLQHVTTIDQILNPAEPAATAATINPVLLVWGLGLMACALFFLITHFRGLHEYKTALPIENAFIAEWLLSHKMVRPVQIRQFDRIKAPLTYGVFRPVILLPKGMDWTDEKQLQYVLTHELTHIKRFDTIWKWLLAASLCIHWFNPLVWVMYVLANRDLELACDEAVVRASGAAQKSSYALTLISMEEKRSRYSPLCNNFSRNAIEERINAIMKLKKASLAGIVAALVLVAGMAAACATSGPNSNTISATPVAQKPSGNQMSGNTGSITARPEQDLSGIDLAGLFSSAKSISDAKNLIQSTSPSDQSKAGLFFRTIKIQFKQDMDESTLDFPNIIVFDDKDSTVVNYLFNFNYDANSRLLHIDIKQESTMKQEWQDSVGSGNVVHVYLTGKIKTADGKFIDHDYVFSFHT